MANEKNLKPIKTLTSEEAKKRGSKGGKASVKAKRERKLLKQQLEMLLNLPVKNDKIKSKLKELGVEASETNNQMAMTLALFQKALSGDVRAYEIIRDTIGEKPVDRVENINPPVINIERPKK